MRSRIMLVVAIVTAASFSAPASADPPCRPLQPPRPICVPDLPGVPQPPVPPFPQPPVPPFPPPLPEIPGLPGIPGFPPVPGIPGVPGVPLPPVPQPPDGTEGIDWPWLPANAGLMWFQGHNDLSPPSAPAGEPNGAVWLTRRIGQHPLMPAVHHVGSLVHGLYISVGGTAWVSATPGCLLPASSPVPGAGDVYQPTRALAMAASGLDVCGIETIAYDPLFPYRVYATTYDHTPSGRIEPGGVYASDDFGLHWRRLVGGFRGNGLAVARSPSSTNARLVAGYIQRTNSEVGSTPGSLSISDDDGATWRAVSLPDSGCQDVVTTSQRITATVRTLPFEGERIYAGTNAGLYVSTDGGATWRLARQACGGIWGIGLSPDGSRVVLGDHKGQIYTTGPDATSFSPVTNLGGERIQDVVVDPLDRDRAFAAVWEGGGAAVYRINLRTNRATRLAEGLLSVLDDVWPEPVPQPFPLGPRMRGGSAPSLFLSLTPGKLMVSTLLRGVFVRPA